MKLSYLVVLLVLFWSYACSKSTEPILCEISSLDLNLYHTNFIDSMYTNVLLNNFVLRYDETVLDSLKLYYSYTSTSSPFISSLKMTTWFMEFDEDNWFSFNLVFTQVNEYLLNCRSCSNNDFAFYIFNNGESSKGIPVVLVNGVSVKWVGILND